MTNVTREEAACMIDGMIYCHQWHNCGYGHCKMRKCRLKVEDERLDLVMETLEKHNLTLYDFARILEAYRRYFMRFREAEDTLMYRIQKICSSFDMQISLLGTISQRMCPSE